MISITRRRFLAGSAFAAGLGVAGAALSACGGNASPREADIPTVSVVLDYSPNVNHTGFYVAIDQGYLAEEGIDVEVVPAPEDGADALIGSGGADMGFSYQDYIANNLASGNPMPYRALAALVQHNTSGIMSRVEDGITSPRFMQDHAYATWNLPVEQATVKRIVEDDGGDFSRVKLVPYEVDDDVAGLTANLYDTVWVYEWWAVQNAKLQGVPVNYFSFAEIDPVFDYYTPVLAANDDFAAKNPDLVRGFMRALRRGYEFAAQRPDEAAQILCKQVPELDADLVTAAQRSISPQYIADASTWGEIDPDRWSGFYEWLNEEGLLEKKIGVHDGYDLSFLDSLD